MKKQETRKPSGMPSDPAARAMKILAGSPGGATEYLLATLGVDRLVLDTLVSENKLKVRTVEMAHPMKNLRVRWYSISDPAEGR